MARKKEKNHSYDDGSFVVKKKRKFNVFAFIVCALVAFVIWVYAEGRTNDVPSDVAVESVQAAEVATETQAN